MSTTSPYLYRILRYEHVLDLLESRELHFARPSSWDDPYENLFSHRRSHAVFAQCWCKKAVSDAMWRIYSPERTSLRIRVSRHKLQTALEASLANKAVGVRIDDVEYLSTTELRKKLRSIQARLSASYSARLATEALLLKRDAFDHEQEVRVILHDQTAQDSPFAATVLRVPIDPFDLIDSVFFDPRVPEAFYKVCRYYLREKLRYRRDVGKSALYRAAAPIVVE